MKGLLGIKLGMTQVIDDKGKVSAVTIIKAGPCYVTQVKSEESDGYNAVQIGFEEIKPARLSKGQLGHLGLVEASKKNPDRKRKENKDIPPVRHLREFRTDSPDEFEIGQQLTVEQFETGQRIDVTGKTKGKGFAGVVKRHGFAGGPKTHGQSDRWRAPGSIGATSTTARVFKGTRMAGRMGNDRQTILNLEVMRIDPERNLIAIKGPVPGAKGGLVMIRPAVKA
ncbi:MAG: 50S ribosomal protein L3 [Chloroflexota bacterium]